MEGDLTEHGIVNIWFMPTAYHTNLIIGRTKSQCWESQCTGPAFLLIGSLNKGSKRCSGGRVVSASASHQCGSGSIPGWGSDPGAVSEKGFVPV